MESKQLMRHIKQIFLMALLLAISAGAQTRYYGAIDLGSKGAKAALFHFVAEGKEQTPEVIFNRVINTRLVSSMKDGEFSEAGIHEAADAVQELLGDMRKEAAKPAKNGNHYNVDHYYVVGSSGVAKADNKDDLAKAVKAATGIDMVFIDAVKEGYYGMRSAVPSDLLRDSMYIDVGSGNTKLGCVVGDSAPKNFKSVEIPFGSVTGRNEGSKRSPSDIKAGIEQVMKDINQAYLMQSMDVPCLRNRQNIYWTGGAAWATATFMHPEKSLNAFVVISRRDINRFLSTLNDGTWNQKEPVLVFPKGTPVKSQENVRQKAKSERDNVMNIFVREDLLSGVSIMKTVLDNSNGSAVVTFARENSYLYGYALELSRETRAGQ
jgi:hypothetical protein